MKTFKNILFTVALTTLSINAFAQVDASQSVPKAGGKVFEGIGNNGGGVIFGGQPSVKVVPPVKADEVQNAENVRSQLPKPLPTGQNVASRPGR